jgi:hypothetical protein
MSDALKILAMQVVFFMALFTAVKTIATLQ